MNIRSLLLSVNGRIGRGAFWLAFFVIWAATWALEWAFGIPIADDPTTLRLRAIDAVIGLVMVYPAAAVVVKRLRDRDQPVAFVWVLVAALTVIQLGNVTGYFDTAAPMTWPKLVMMILIAAVVLTFIVELGFRRGTLQGREAR